MGLLVDPTCSRLPQLRDQLLEFGILLEGFEVIVGHQAIGVFVTKVHSLL